MRRLTALSLVLSLLWSGLASAQTDDPAPAYILDAARRAVQADLPPLDALDGWSHAVLEDIKTTALGCRLIKGLNLPAPIEVYRLELRYGDSTYRVHVSADATLVRLCDERFPGLRGGLAAAAPGDRDGDAVINRADLCPTIAGIAAAPQPGCPHASAGDRDGDGQPDRIDLCPNQAGSAAADGCAILPDADADGVPNIDDICPRDAGVIRSDFALGCPKNGSGSSPHRRASSDVCRVLGDRIRLFDRAMLNASVIGIYEHSSAVPGAGDVIGRDAAAAWYQLKDGWAAAGSLQLRGACYNIPLVKAAVGSATGCFLRPRAAFANVRNGPAADSRAVAKIYPDQIYAALGRGFGDDWLFFNQGWVSRTALELLGDCSSLPILDPELAGSGAVFFCPPEFTGWLPPRIAIGKANARIAAGGIPSRLRAQPSISAAQIGEIPPGRTLDAVLDGPACKEHFVWWQVQVDGSVGWTAESDVMANVYYIEPVAAVGGAIESSRPATARRPASPAAFQMITSASALKVSVIHTLPAASPLALAWSPAQSRLALISAAGDIDIYSYPNFDKLQGGYHLPDTLDATAIAFSAADRFLAVGNRDGRVYIAELDGAGAWLPQSHTSPVRALAWSRQGYQLASASGFDQSPAAGSAWTLRVWHLNDFSPPARPRLFIHYGFPYPLADLAFSADDAWLAVTGASSARQQAAIWIYSADDAELRFSKALVYSQGNSFVTRLPDPSLGDFAYNHGDSVYRISVESAEDIRFYQQPAALFKQLVFRSQVIQDAEVLFALALTDPGAAADSGTVRFVNVLNSAAPTASRRLNPSDIAFSPDGRVIAAAEADKGRVLILGVTDE